MVKRVCPRCLSKHFEPIEDCPNPIYDKDYQDEVIREPRRPTISPARVRISELLKCPVDWQAIAPDQGISVSLERFWEEVASECLLEGEGLLDTPQENSVKHGELTELSDLSDEQFELLLVELQKIDGETFDEYFKPVILEVTAEEDLIRDLPDIEAWITRARAKYKSAVYRFEKMRMAYETDYRKHFPPSNISTEEIRNRTGGRPGKDSLFYKGITPARLENLMWTILDEVWRQILDVNHARVYVDACTIIGASKGKDTRYIYFDIDLSTPITHAYPILAEEIPNDEDIIRIDNLQGYTIIDS
jgi:hypothetical protein